MSVLSRDFEVGGIGRNGVLIAVVGLAVVLSLFFIPEIIEFQRSFSSGEAAGAASKKERVATANVSQSEDRPEDLQSIRADDSASMIDRLSALLDSDRTKTEPRASLAAPKSKSNPKKSAGQKGDVTWDKIRSAESKAALEKARAAAIKLSERVGSRAVLSRHALINFSNGIDFILERGHQKMKPNEAASYIAALGQSVNRAMSQESVDRKVLTQWSKVSLGPVLGDMLDRSDDLLPQHFNPQLTLTWAKLSQRARDGAPDPRAPLRAQIGGYVIGDDITSLELISPEGGRARTLNLTRSRTYNGYRFFRFQSVGQRSTVLRLRDKHGRIFEKGYDFPLGVRQFPFEYRVYQLPFSMSFATPRRFIQHDVDPRLDAFFTKYTWVGTEAELASRTMRATTYAGLESSAEGQLFSTF
ncbi:MAG: hypothetical protein EBZ48_01400 [Proteobacteria bacterium]|nr:hypothetical protein [Pseudomonadota bacterium]